MSNTTTLCQGAQGINGEPLCEGPDCRDVAFRFANLPWVVAQWCADCRDAATANGATVVVLDKEGR